MTALPLIILAIENDGDRAFMEKLYLDHYRLMRAAARKVLMTGDDADDVVNEALIRLIGKISVLKALDCYTLRATLSLPSGTPPSTGSCAATDGPSTRF